MPVTIQNGDIRRKISEDIRATNPSLISNLLTDYIVPMMLVNDDVYYAQESFSEHTTVANDSSEVIMTTDSIKDTYIVNVTLGVIKDATATSTLSAITAVIGGVTKTLISIPGITLTAQSETVSASFSPPVKVDRSSAITMTATTATGNFRNAGSVQGFLRVKN